MNDAFPWLRFMRYEAELRLEGERTDKNMVAMTSPHSAWLYLYRSSRLVVMQESVGPGHRLMIYIHKSLVGEPYGQR